MSTIVNKSVKKTPIEETFFLSDLLENGCCLRCINKSCRINEKHGGSYPERISTFVQNPTYITGMSKAIEDALLDFNGKKTFFTVCNYVNKKCRNCEEGRIKYLNIDDKKIILCYPILNDIKTKVTIGIHIDIKLIMKGHKYDVSFIPIVIDSPIVNDSHGVFSTPEVIDIPVVQEWPSLIKKENSFEKNNNIKDFSHIKKIHDTLIEEVDTLKMVEPLKDDTLKMVEQSKLDNLKKIDEERLFNRIKFLNNEIDKLKEELLEKNKNLERFGLINKHANIYEEILYNIDEINNRVTEQFLNTTYSEYIVF